MYASHISECFCSIPTRSTLNHLMYRYTKPYPNIGPMLTHHAIYLRTYIILYLPNIMFRKNHIHHIHHIHQSISFEEIHMVSLGRSSPLAKALREVLGLARAEPSTASPRDRSPEGEIGSAWPFFQVFLKEQTVLFYGMLWDLRDFDGILWFVCGFVDGFCGIPWHPVISYPRVYGMVVILFLIKDN